MWFCKDAVQIIFNIPDFFELVNSNNTLAGKKIRGYKLSYVNLYDPNANVKLAMASVAAVRSGALTALNWSVGTDGIARLRDHFMAVRSQLTGAENALCARGEKLFDL